MNWLKKLFGRKVVVLEWRDTLPPEQQEMYDEQLKIQAKLGFSAAASNAQNWLRLHQILLDYEKRLKVLEGK